VRVNFALTRVFFRSASFFLLLHPFHSFVLLLDSSAAHVSEP
jgi:hypothetical protein